MRETQFTIRSDNSAHSDAAGCSVVQGARCTRRGRPFSALTQWLRPQIARFQSQGCSCWNVFLAIGAYEDDASPKSFVVSPATADLYRHEIGEISGQRVTWGHFRKLWQRMKQSTHEKIEVPYGN